MENQQAARMVDEALLALEKPRSTIGVSLQAIKNYSVEKYGVDMNVFGLLIRKYILRQIENGHLKRTSGKGAAGSFRLSSARARALIAADKRKDESNLAHGSSKNAEKPTVPVKSHMRKQAPNSATNSVESTLPRNRTVTAVNRKRAAAPSPHGNDADELVENTASVRANKRKKPSNVVHELPDTSVESTLPRDRSARAVNRKRVAAPSSHTAPARTNKRRQSMHDRPGTSEESTLPRDRSARAVNRKRVAAPSSDENDADAENTASVKANKHKKPSNVVHELSDTSVESTLLRGRSAGAAGRELATAPSADDDMDLLASFDLAFYSDLSQ